MIQEMQGRCLELDFKVIMGIHLTYMQTRKKREGMISFLGWQRQIRKGCDPCHPSLLGPNKKKKIQMLVGNDK